MAIVETELNQKQSKALEKADPNKKTEIMYNVFPDMERHYDYKNKSVRIEVALPGVKKEDIELKVLPKWFHLQAKRGHLMYSANQQFGKKVVPEKTTANYDSGLLTITAYLPDPFEGAKVITF